MASSLANQQIAGRKKESGALAPCALQDNLVRPFNGRLPPAFQAKHHFGCLGIGGAFRFQVPMRSFDSLLHLA